MISTYELARSRMEDMQREAAEYRRSSLAPSPRRRRRRVPAFPRWHSALGGGARVRPAPEPPRQEGAPRTDDAAFRSRAA